MFSALFTVKPEAAISMSSAPLSSGIDADIAEALWNLVPHFENLGNAAKEAIS